LTVEQATISNGQTIVCINQKDFTVLPSNPAEITDIFITGTGNAITLDVRVAVMATTNILPTARHIPTATSSKISPRAP